MESVRKTTSLTTAVAAGTGERINIAGRIRGQRGTSSVLLDKVYDLIQDQRLEAVFLNEILGSERGILGDVERQFQCWAICMYVRTLGNEMGRYFKTRVEYQRNWNVGPILYALKQISTYKQIIITQ